MKKFLICGTAGGHLSEILTLFDDAISETPHDFIILTEKSTRVFPEKVRIFTYFAPRNPYLKIPFSLFKALFLIIAFRPEWIISTGAQVGIGSILACKLFLRKTMFIETVTRYKTPTKSAKILYPLVDKFFVQHQEVLKLFGPKAEYIGGII